MLKRYCFLFTPPLALLAQAPPIDCYQLDYTQELPKTLFEERAVGITIMHACQDQTKTWQELAQEAHLALSTVGIDLVAHFNRQDLYANFYTREAYATAWRRRAIKHLAFFVAPCPHSTHQDSTRLIITPFNQEPSFLHHEQQAWECIAPDLKTCAQRIDQYIINQQLTIQNFLIQENIETFLVNLIPKKRSALFPSKLKDTWLAVLSEDATRSSLPETCLPTSREQQQRIDTVLAAHFPNKYAFVSPHEDLLKLYRRGYEYLLVPIYTSAPAIQTMLKYPPHTNKQALPSTPVYKFYLKHMLSQNVYLGRTWDADPSLEQALKNFLQK